MRGHAEEPLEEREDELLALDGLISDAQGGSGRLTLIEGPPGVGKTRLLAATCERAQGRGMEVLTARGGELERDFAFGIVRQLLEPCLRAAAPAEREELMLGAAQFSEPVFAEPAVETERAGDPSYAVLHGLYWLVANIVERGPIVVAVDDAHWSDGPSLRFLAFLARRLQGMGLLIALASRRGEPGAEAELLSALCLDVGARHIQPRLLSVEAVERVVRSRLGETIAEDLCAACHEATGGNPFLLGELLLELVEESSVRGFVAPAVARRLGPHGVTVAVLGRLGRLPSAATALARAVAVLGQRAELRHASALASLERENASSAADLLIRAGVLERGRPLRFLHPILRTAIYEDIPEADRSHAHARAAGLLAEDGVTVDAVALQLLAVEPRGSAWIGETLREAARGALERGAPEVAARYLRRALAEGTQAPAEVLVELGAAEARAGEPAAREHLAAALERASAPSLQVQATLELAQVIAYGGELEQAAKVVLRTLERVRDRAELARWMEIVLLTFAQADLAARRLTRELLRRAAGAVERLGESAPRNLLAIVALERVWADGTAKDAAALAERALAEGRLAQELTADAPHPYIASLALTFADRGELAERELAAAMADARERGSARGFGLASATRAWTRYRMGALDGAEADARAFLELGSDPAWYLFRPTALAALVDVLVERGELSAADGALGAWDVGPKAPESSLAQPLRESRARLDMAAGRPDDALRELTACARWETAWNAHNGVWTQWRSAAALAHLARGETASARVLANEELRRMRRFGARRSTGIALSAAGVVHGGEEGIELLREAAELLETSEARLEHARALLRLGAAIRRAGRRTEARVPLSCALDLAARLGAGVIGETARQELLAAGARPRRTVLRGRDALTPSERRVAEMAATGQSNREIAQSLFLTVRTIEMHLTNAYRKLTINSRAELTAALADEQSEGTAVAARRHRGLPTPRSTG